MRDEKELIELIRSVQKWFYEDFQLPFDAVIIAEHVEKLKHMRVNEFVKRRIGHLRDNDLVRFAKLFKEDPLREIPKVKLPIEDGSKGKQRVK